MTGWVVGFAIGGVVVVLVVALLLLMIRGAVRVRGKAEAILAALVEARDNTAPLWDVQTTNAVADRIVAAAAATRVALEEGAR